MITARKSADSPRTLVVHAELQCVFRRQCWFVGRPDKQVAEDDAARLVTSFREGGLKEVLDGLHCCLTAPPCVWFAVCWVYFSRTAPPCVWFAVCWVYFRDLRKEARVEMSSLQVHKRRRPQATWSVWCRSGTPQVQ